MGTDSLLSRVNRVPPELTPLVVRWSAPLVLPTPLLLPEAFASPTARVWWGTPAPGRRARRAMRARTRIGADQVGALVRILHTSHLT